MFPMEVDEVNAMPDERGLLLPDETREKQARMTGSILLKAVSSPIMGAPVTQRIQGGRLWHLKCCCSLSSC